MAKVLDENNFVVVDICISDEFDTAVEAFC